MRKQRNINDPLTKKKMGKRLVIFVFAWTFVVPAVAGGAVLLLWNQLVPSLTGFAAIGFWQALGLFLLGQLLSGGFIFGLFLLAFGLHAIFHKHNHAAMEKWKHMTDEQRREIFLRRMSRFGQRHFMNQPTEGDGNGAAAE